MDLEKPILLGFSGGVDSMALLAMLEKVKEARPINLHLVHVDHKCRESSTKEAAFLKKLADRKNLPFHLYTLNHHLKNSRNLEDFLRDERYKKFKECYDKIDAQTLLVAHHKDDLVETVLKRVLEGSYITNFSGLKPSTFAFGMKIVRPLLQYTKQFLKDLMSLENQEWIEDVTNKDTKYLRARMRHEMVPMLEKSFGKTITNSFSSLSNNALLLEEYLLSKTKPFLDLILEGPFGKCLDLKEQKIHPFECEFLLRHILKSYDVTFSKDQLSKILQCVFSGKSNKSFVSNNFKIIVDDKRVFFLPIEVSDFSQEVNVLSVNDPIRISLLSFKFEKLNKIPEVLDWKMLWQGLVVYRDLDVPITLKPSLSKSKKSQSLFAKQKVPSFLRKVFPVLSSVKFGQSLPLDLWEVKNECILLRCIGQSPKKNIENNMI